MKKILAFAFIMVFLASCGGPSLSSVYDSGYYKIGYNENMTLVHDGAHHWIEGNYKIAFGVTSSKLFEIKDWNSPPPGLVGFSGEGMTVEKTSIHGLQAMWIEGKTSQGKIFACLYPLEGATVYAYTELLNLPKNEDDNSIAKAIVESLEVTSPDMAVAAAINQEKDDLAKPTLQQKNGADAFKPTDNVQEIIKEIQKGMEPGKGETQTQLQRDLLKGIDKYKLMKDLVKPQDR